jgi:hypothetical protein
MVTIAEKPSYYKLKKILLGTLLIIIILFTLLVILLPTITEYVIEKYSEDWIGRKVEMEDLYLNLLTGEVEFEQLKVHEHQSASLFFQCESLYTNVTLYKLFRNRYEFTETRLLQPILQIIQTDSTFNFDDLLALGNKSEETETTSPTPPVQYWINNILVEKGILRYANQNIGNEVVLAGLHIACPVIQWDQPDTKYNTEFSLQSGGKINADFLLNHDSLNYQLRLQAESLNINLLLPYLQEYLKVNNLSGAITSSFQLTGDFNQVDALATSGDFTLENFSLIDSREDSVAAFKELLFEIDTLNVTDNIYNFRNISLTAPFLKYEMYENGDNFTALLSDPLLDSTTVADSVYANEYANPFVLMAGLISNITSNYIISNYEADSLIVTGGNIIYQDYTLHDKFAYNLESLSMITDRVSSDSSRIKIDIKSTLNNSGNLTAQLSVSPKDFMDMELYYKITDLLISDFTPYSTYYVAHPFWDGVVYYDSKNIIIDRNLISENSFRVERIELGDKITNETAYKLPLKLAVALLKDIHGNIELDIPIEGDLSDPKYKLWKAIVKVLENLIVKAVTSPYRLLARSLGANEDDLKGIHFDELQDSLTQKQQKGLDLIAKVLNAKPDLKAELIDVSDSVNELETLAITEAKKQFYLENHPDEDEFSALLIDSIGKISSNDSLFNAYLNQKLNLDATTLMPIYSKCIQLIGESNLGEQLATIRQKREQYVKTYLLENKEVAQERLLVSGITANDTLKPAPHPMFVINYFVE